MLSGFCYLFIYCDIGNRDWWKPPWPPAHIMVIELLIRPCPADQWAQWINSCEMSDTCEHLQFSHTSCSGLSHLPRPEWHQMGKNQGLFKDQFPIFLTLQINKMYWKLFLKSLSNQIELKTDLKESNIFFQFGAKLAQFRAKSITPVSAAGVHSDALSCHRAVYEDCL